MGAGGSDCGQGGSVKVENAGTVYRVQVKTVQICGPGEESRREEEKHTKGEGKGCCRFDILDPTFVHSARLVQ